MIVRKLVKGIEHTAQKVVHMPTMIVAAVFLSAGVRKGGGRDIALELRG